MISPRTVAPRRITRPLVSLAVVVSPQMATVGAGRLEVRIFMHDPNLRETAA